jgi:catalase
VLEDGTAVQRTFLTSLSVEFDAVVLLGAPAPAPDAPPARDAKAGAAAPPELDPRVALMVEEAYRHAKALAALDGGAAVLDLVGADASTPGVVLGDDPDALVEGLLAEMGAHRAWERFPSRIGA